MNFLKKNYTLRRYSEPQYVQGYSSIPYEDLTIKTEEDGRKSIQKLKVFCDYEILAEDEHKKQQKADRVWFQGKWFECLSSRLSENTPLRHWTATFVQCLDAEDGPKQEGE